MLIASRRTWPALAVLQAGLRSAVAGLHVGLRPALAGVPVGLLAALILCTTSLAAPVTVKLRVEGSTKTLFEGDVTTQGEAFEAPSSKGPHPCDYSENGFGGREANGGNASGTPTTALHAAALANGLPFDAKWFGSGKEENENPGDFLVTQVGPDANETSSPYDSWGYAVNYTTAPVGGCQIALAPGSEVLWAYNYLNLKHLLSLSGPTAATAGTPFTLHVVDGQTGEPIAGAAIGELVGGVTTPLPGNPTTSSSGAVTVTLANPGAVTLKATREDSVRSNGLAVNVEPPASCACLAPHVTPPPRETLSDVARVEGVENGHTYSRRTAPRVLAGTIEVPAEGTLRQVRISLERRARGRCYDFSGARERFVRIKCAKAAELFSVGGTESFSYLLPARLPAGRYVYDVEALNDAGQVTPLANGVSHVAFTVR
jgi:hypothetical protein